MTHEARQMVEEIIFDGRNEFLDKYNVSKLVDFVAWLNGLLDSVPKGQRNEVKMEFEPYEEYESNQVDLKVWYEREETNQEIAQRLFTERKDEDDMRTREIIWARSVLQKYGLEK